MYVNKCALAYYFLVSNDHDRYNAVTGRQNKYLVLERMFFINTSDQASFLPEMTECKERSVPNYWYKPSAEIYIKVVMGTGLIISKHFHN